MVTTIEDFVRQNYQKKNPQHKDWETPPDFFKKLDGEFHFTLDAAASCKNALLPRYCSTEGLNYVSLDGYELFECDGGGLGYSWKGERVFCNPPYDSSLKDWVAKAAEREAEVAVLLLPPSVDTKWFHALWGELGWGRLDGTTQNWAGEWNGVWSERTEILFYTKRLRFFHDGKPGMAPRAGNMLAIFRR